MDVAHGEMVEKELDAMIERRSRKGEVDPDEREELWKESVRRYAGARSDGPKQHQLYLGKEAERNKRLPEQANVYFISDSILAKAAREGQGFNPQGQCPRR